MQEVLLCKILAHLADNWSDGTLRECSLHQNLNVTLSDEVVKTCANADVIDILWNVRRITIV